MKRENFVVRFFLLSRIFLGRENSFKAAMFFATGPNTCLFCLDLLHNKANCFHLILRNFIKAQKNSGDSISKHVKSRT